MLHDVFIFILIKYFFVILKTIIIYVQIKKIIGNLPKSEIK